MNRFMNYVFSTVLILLSINNFIIFKNIDIYISNDITNDNRIVRDIYLNNSYYLQYVVVNRDSDFRSSMTRDYFVLNIDRDDYPDILIWYPCRLIVWSYKRGVYSRYYCTSTSQLTYITKPIPVDYNGDNVIDHVFVFESSYMDSAILSSSTYIDRFYTYVYRWDPLYGTRSPLATLRGVYVDTSTYHVIGDYIFIPAVINYYDNYRNNTRTYGSRVGLLRIHRFSGLITQHSIKTYSVNVPETGKPIVNDYTTNYEIYVIGSGEIMYIIPSGLDRVIRVRYVSGNIILDKEYSLGNMQWNDNRMVLARDYPAIPFGALATESGTYWRSPQRLDIKLSGNDLIIPSVDFNWLNPTDSENSVYFRVERVRGVIVLSTSTGRYREEVFLDGLFNAGGKTYTVRIVTSIFIDTSSSIIYYGGVGVETRGTGHIAFVNTYNYRTGENRNVWFREITSQMLAKAFQVTINTYGSRRVFTTLYALRVENDSRDVFFHVFQNCYTQPKYTQQPPSTIKPIVLDIDRNGVEEYVFIMQYADYTGYRYSPGGIEGMYPVVRRGISYIVWFRKPLVKLTTECSDETCQRVRLSNYFDSTSYSSILIEVKDSNGSTVYRRNISGNTWFGDTIVFQNPGRYRIDASTNTVYYVYEFIDGTGIMYHTVVYSENMPSFITFFVRYRTRILINKPYLQIMTPNHYANGLQIEFVLEYFNFNDNKWYRLPGQSVLLTVALINGTSSVVRKPLDLGYGVYTCLLNNVFPSRYSLQVNYTGSSIYLPVSISKSLNLIPYPVFVEISYSSETPALTPFNISVNLTYMYIDSSGGWIESILRTGRSIELTVYVKNKSDNLVFRNNYSISAIIITIPREKILPGEYCFTVKYVPSSVYYSQGYSVGNYRVSRLKLWVNIIDLFDNMNVLEKPIVIYGSTLMIEIREYVSNTDYRDLSTNMMILFNGFNRTYSIVTRNAATLVNTIYIKPGYYEVVVHPIEYSLCYEPLSYIFYINITEARGSVIGILEPFVKINTTSLNAVKEKTVITYALTPVYLYLNTSTYPEELLEKALVKVVIDNNTYIVEDCTKPFVFTPVKPGYKEIKLVLEAYFLRIVNYTYLTVYPHPVSIVVENSSIVIKTIDLLNRSASGTLYIEVYDMYRKLLLRNTYRTNGLLVINNSYVEGWIYVYVVFRGNESYAESSLLKYIYIGFRNIRLRTVSEQSILSFIILTVLIIYLVKRMKKSRYY